MDIKKLKINDWIFGLLETLIIGYSLFLIIDSLIEKSEAKRRKFEEATNITQQLYFQDLESLASIQFISGIVLLIFASTIFSIYFRIIRK
ncbi:MAG: hypothetical protein CL761_03550 [Chloroflexi bacterium]|nr:hypothetical protein [Chloroflexota bacterium]|tara:strand:+ start:981 stop:1250 length:270 start_codon:yes stop_codon:yes gene_type:complete